MPRSGWKKKVVACEFDPSRFALAGEEWKPVVGWEGFYRVSNLGRLYSLHQSGRFVTGMLVRGGYRILKLREGERHANATVHRMVLEAFVGPPPQGCEACHGVGGVGDNALTNLRWGTKESNQADRIEHGTDNYSSWTLTPTQVRAIRTSPEISDEQWAEKLGVTPMCILQARVGKTWRKVDVPPLRRDSSRRRYF